MTFVVTHILERQALDSINPCSDLKALDSGEILSSGQMFTGVYTGEDHLTLQTCIARDGNDSWGRLFILAEPIITQAE